MKTYNKNQEHINSGVEWLRQTPTQWKIMPLRSIAKENNNKNSSGLCTNLLSLSYGKIIEKNIESNSGLLPESFNTYQIVKTGNIVLRLTDLQNDKVSLRVGYVDTDKPGIITSAYLALDLAEQMNPKYVYFLLHAYDIQKVFYAMGGGVRQTLDYKNFKYLPILVPKLDLQAEIANYLEKKINFIDQTISKKKELIDLLQEKRTAIITQAVKKGLDPKVKMKDSGVEWIGKIPKSWKMFRIKNLVEINKKSLGEETPDDYQFDYVDIGNVNSQGEILSLQPYTYAKSPSRARRIAQENDIIISTVRTYLKAMARIKNAKGLVFSTGFAVIHPTKINSDQLYWSMQSEAFLSQVSAYSTGVGYPCIKENVLSTLAVPVPNESDQVEINLYLTLKTRSIDSASKKLRSQIVLLEEYRSSLIYHAVTGKIKT